MRNTHVGTVDAQDRDTTAPNNVLRFTIVRDSVSDFLGTELVADTSKSNSTDCPFVITANGNVLVSGPIDYERRKEYSFIVLATDGGTPQRTGSTVVVIDIEDINDNVPEWLFPNSTFR